MSMTRLALRDLLPPGETIDSWLAVICTCGGDVSGTAQNILDAYEDTFRSKYDSVEQIIELYVVVSNGDDIFWSQDFFDDAAIREEHQAAFRGWLLMASGRLSEKDEYSCRLKQDDAACVEPALSERRVDPDDGKIYTWLEFRIANVDKYGPEDIKAYWRVACKEVSLETPSAERRVDPDDGREWSCFADFESNHSGRYSAEDIRKYWEVACQPVKVVQVLDDSCDANVVRGRDDTPAADNLKSESGGSTGLAAGASSCVVDRDPSQPWFMVEGSGHDFADRRVDPDDQRAVMYEEFQSKHRSKFTGEDVEEYWLRCCKTVIDWKRDR